MASQHAEVKIELSLTSDTYRRSSPDSPKLVVTTTITSADVDVLTLEVREGQDNDTVLQDGFYMEHFTFYDLTTDSEVIDTDPSRGGCEPREDLDPDSVVELRSSMPLVTTHMLGDWWLLSEPMMRQLDDGHEYRITLIPQTVWCFAGSKQELFGDKKSVPVEDLPEGMRVRLESADELRLKVEA